VVPHQHLFLRRWPRQNHDLWGDRRVSVCAVPSCAPPKAEVSFAVPSLRARAPCVLGPFKLTQHTSPIKLDTPRCIPRTQHSTVLEEVEQSQVEVSCSGCHHRQLHQTGAVSGVLCGFGTGPQPCFYHRKQLRFAQNGELLLVCFIHELRHITIFFCICIFM
jgi:hypothetical protein